MILPPPRRLLAPSLLSSLVALSCGGTGSGSTQPDLPQASILVEDTNTVGKSVKLTISVSGCTQVQKLELLNDDALLKTVPFSGNPTAVELTTTDISFAQGISANLSLTARVTCDDGRTNVSQAQPATFLPVAEVIEPINDSDQVVPDYFAVDGSGDNASFVGCGLDSGRSYLYRVKKSDPTHYDSFEMSFTCGPNTIVTARKPASSGTRWVWTPGQSALSIDANFKRTGDTDLATAVATLTVGPDGSALVSDGHTLQRVLPSGTVQWTAPNDDVSSGGDILGDPIVRKGGTSASDTVAVAKQELNLDAVDVRVAIYKYSDGSLVSTYKIAHITPIQTVLGAFDATGTVLYLSMQTDSTTNPLVAIEACAVGASTTELCKAGTTTKTRLWASDSLPGNLVGMFPYNNGTRLAAIAGNRYWFLDAQSTSATVGKVVNKGQLPLTPNGALVARFVQQGLNDSSFYIFNSAQASDDVPYPGPVEIMATDAAEKGLLYRYQTPGNSLYGSLDDSGAMWLRVGRKLVKPLTLAQYRQLMP